jgi:hypothetical protein
MITRARLEKPNQLPSGSRIDAGMRSASDADFTGWKSPAAAPTTAARIDDHQHVGRAVGPFALDPLEQLFVPASMRLILMPVALVKLS